jgi:glycolate oxidase
LSQKNLFSPLEASEISLASMITNSLFPSLKYYILGMRTISPTGSILRLGGRTVKNVTGYNILGMFFGSRGIFGIPTQVTLKLTPLPDFDYTENKEISRRQPKILLRLKKELDPNNIMNRNILGEI